MTLVSWPWKTRKLCVLGGLWRNQSFSSLIAETLSGQGSFEDEKESKPRQRNTFTNDLLLILAFRVCQRSA